MRVSITFAITLTACSTYVAVPGTDAGIGGDTGVPDSGLVADAPVSAVDAPDAGTSAVDAASAPDAPEARPDAGTGVADASVTDAGAVDAPSVPAAPVGAPSSITTARCALDGAGALWCWDATGALMGYGGVFVRARGSCAQRADDSVACTSPSGLVEIDVSVGELLEYSSASSGCTNDRANLHCWGGGRACTWNGMGDAAFLLDPAPSDRCATAPSPQGMWSWSTAYPDRLPIEMGWVWFTGADGSRYAAICRTYTLAGAPAAGAVTNCVGPSTTFQMTISVTPGDAELVVTHGANCAVQGTEVACRRRGFGALYRVPGTGVGIIDNPLASDNAEVCVWDGGLTCYSLDYASGAVTTELYTVEW